MCKKIFIINPNLHCFIAITKAPACGLKEPLLPQPHSPVRGRGKGVLLYGPEDLLNKNMSYILIIIKSILKMTF
jgi:hypothetical protein